jgi:hypothetical protein
LIIGASGVSRQWNGSPTGSIRTGQLKRQPPAFRGLAGVWCSFREGRQTTVWN